MLGDGNGSRLGSLLPYAVERDVVVLGGDGARRFSWLAPERVTALSALLGKVAAATEGGLVTVLNAAGEVVTSVQFSGDVSAVKHSGNGLLAQVGSRLELHRSDQSRTFALPRAARLVDAIGDRALYVARGQAGQLLLSSGARHTLGPGSQVQADLSTLATAGGRTVSVRRLP